MSQIASKRDARTPGIEDNEYNRFISRHSPVECINGLGNCLSGSKMFRFSIFLSLNCEFSSDDIGCTRYRMTMPLQFSVWRESDSHGSRGRIADYEGKLLSAAQRMVCFSIPALLLVSIT